MPRKLTLQLEGKDIVGSLKALSRDDVYGKIIIERRDNDGNIFKNAYLSSDGTHVVPSGGMGSSYLNEDGFYTKETIVVGEDGKELPKTKSMYSGPVNIESTINLLDYFCYDVERLYVLESENLQDLKIACEKLLEEQDKLYKFTYAYYDTVDPKDAILIPKDDVLLVAIGEYIAPVMLKPQEILYYDEEEEEEPEFDVW
ncbi:MAG: hypothetical protein JW891_09555 [Candidatus Lokiarchaeota archaeon]|nr:hypothetical protein [Candidatus Lokiarchaeota archaeon]